MKRARWRERLAGFDRRPLALALAAGALALALLEPSAHLERPVYRHLFILDITQSMNTLDYLRDGRAVSRLAQAKAAIKHAIARLPCGSRIGLGVFTEHRSMILIAPVEVCGGYTELTATLERLDWRMAWAGASEVAKGLYSGLRLAQDLEPAPNVVFVTDGHEAPPVHPAYRPRFGGEPGQVPGLIVGAGGFIPMPIPKYDMAGKPLGYWRADEVVQTATAGRPTGESMVDAEGRAVAPARAGAEHLSVLKESYLQALAGETGLGYRRLTTAADFGEALTARAWTRPAEARTDLRPAVGLFALACMVWAYGMERPGRRAGSGARGPRRRKPWRWLSARSGRGSRTRRMGRGGAA
jgi:mxaL protein